MSFEEQRAQMERAPGFIAALDQSGGSTPKALKLYGIEASDYASEAEMFDLIHAMRARIAMAPGFERPKVIGAILFEMTMDREISGKPSATYLWEDRGIVPFLKVDKGLETEAHGVQLMKPIPGLAATLVRAKEGGIFGTKMRSVIKSADANGILSNVAQQFVIGDEILNHGLVPILEPEVDINAPDKSEAEEILRDQILGQLDALPKGRDVMLKLTLPSQDGFYSPLIAHDRVIRVVALSGGYSRDEANAKLSQNPGMIASFSRALSEGLSVDQSDDDFSKTLGIAIDAIAQASAT
ncbi:MAG: fructose bisphosphate aldolase [Pseudomonadota bacterium]